MEKCQETYIGHLARLGVISHIAELAGPLQEVETVPEEPEVKTKEEETEKKVWMQEALHCIHAVYSTSVLRVMAEHQPKNETIFQAVHYVNLF